MSSLSPEDAPLTSQGKPRSRPGGRRRGGSGDADAADAAGSSGSSTAGEDDGSPGSHGEYARRMRHVAKRFLGSYYRDLNDDPERVAVVMAECDDDMVTKQLGFILARHRVKFDCEDDEALGEIIGNAQLSEHFLSLARDLDVLEPTETRGVGATAANVWPGWTCAGITDRSNILIRFPPDATPRQRAALLATMMLVEFSHFEWKKGEHEGNLAYAL